MVRAIALVLLLVPTSGVAATLCVNPLGSGGCASSIQAAVDAAGSGDVIDVQAGIYAENVVVGPPARLTLQGAGPLATRIDGNDLGPALTVQPGVNAIVSGIGFEDATVGVDLADQARLTLSDCEATDNDIGISTGLRSTATVTSCAITSNAGGVPLAHAAGIDARGKFTLVSSTVSGNGDVGVWITRAFKIIDSTVSGNQGIGVWVWEPGTISGSTISGNAGTGIYARGTGTLRVRNTTVSGNLLGGIDSVRRLDLDHATITGNSAPLTGGGLREFASAKVVMRSSIIAGNTAPTGPDCFSDAVRSVGPNLIGDQGGCAVTGSAATGDPLLGPLQNNGGSTETHALLPGSPALGVLLAPGACRAPDQRGVARTVPCDLGAYEAP